MKNPGKARVLARSSPGFKGASCLACFQATYCVVGRAFDRREPPSSGASGRQHGSMRSGRRAVDARQESVDPVVAVSGRVFIQKPIAVVAEVRKLGVRRRRADVEVAIRVFVRDHRRR